MATFKSIKSTVKVTLILVLSSISGLVLAQEKSNKGTEFWLGFMAHVEGTDAGMSLYITSDSSTSGTVSIPGQNWSTNFNVTANSMTVVSVPVNSRMCSKLTNICCYQVLRDLTAHATSAA